MMVGKLYDMMYCLTWVIMHCSTLSAFDRELSLLVKANFRRREKFWKMVLLFGHLYWNCSSVSNSKMALKSFHSCDCIVQFLTERSWSIGKFSTSSAYWTIWVSSSSSSLPAPPTVHFFFFTGTTCMLSSLMMGSASDFSLASLYFIASSCFSNSFLNWLLSICSWVSGSFASSFFASGSSCFYSAGYSAASLAALFF